MDEIQLSSEEIELTLAEEIADNETTRATAREEPSQRRIRIGRNVSLQTKPHNLPRDFIRHHNSCIREGETP